MNLAHAEATVVELETSVANSSFRHFPSAEIAADVEKLRMNDFAIVHRYLSSYLSEMEEVDSARMVVGVSLPRLMGRLHYGSGIGSQASTKVCPYKTDFAHRLLLVVVQHYTEWNMRKPDFVMLANIQLDYSAGMEVLRYLSSKC